MAPEGGTLRGPTLGDKDVFRGSPYLLNYSRVPTRP